MSDAKEVLEPEEELCSKTIVFHPGSKYLRFERASAPRPQTILHAVARRKLIVDSQPKESDENKTSDTNFIFCAKRSSTTFPPEVESARLQLCHTLQTSTKSDGTLRYATPAPQIAALNSKVAEETCQGCNRWNRFKCRDAVVGDEVLLVDPGTNEFTVTFPWQRGQPNVHSGVGGSLTAVFSDLEYIWRWCVVKKLGVSEKNIKNHRAIIVVPATMERMYAVEMLNLALQRLGFGEAFLAQDHVCATFGYGISSAVVVDVGDQKSSISCVVDGVSLAESRMELKYGGGDLSIALWNLLGENGFPLNLNTGCLWDFDFLNRLKESLCHCNVDRCGPEGHTVVYNRPNNPLMKYTITFGDELLIAPLSYFNPDLLKGSANQPPVVTTQRSYKENFIPDDYLDENFFPEQTISSAKKDFDDGESEHADVQTPRRDQPSVDQLIGIEQAILSSINSSDTDDDTKSALCNSVLVVGGGFLFDGLSEWLQAKLASNASKALKMGVGELKVKVLANSRTSNPKVTSWCGAAIMGTLDSADGLWIKEAEWSMKGSRVLREKSLLFC